MIFPRQPVSKPKAITFSVLALFLAGVVIARVMAAGSAVTWEAENGTRTAGATVMSATGQSGSGVVKFGAASNSPYLPFDMPDSVTMRPVGGKVFAHYWPALTRSLQNEDPSTLANALYNRYNPPLMSYPAGSDAFGGYLRDQPIPRSPRSTALVNVGAASIPQWRIDDAKDDVRDAIAGGLDGFAVDIMCMPGCADLNQVPATRAIFYAGPQIDPGFKLMVMLDMSASFSDTQTQTDIANYIAELGSTPAAYKLNGRLVVSTFKAEDKPASWYTDLFTVLKNNHGIDVTFMPVFLNDRTYRDQYDAISYGMGFWGNRSPASNSTTATDANSVIGRINAIKALGQKTFVPAAVQDVRPRELKYDEALNTTNLRNMWEIARTTSADYVQFITWSDFTESTNVMPSKRNSYGYMDLNAYFIYWFKNGVQPNIVRDRLYLTHRTHPMGATPTYTGLSGLFVNRSDASPPRDTVEVVAFLTDPATVQVTSGGVTDTYSGVKGMNVFTAPLRVGNPPSAKAVRSNVTVQSVTSNEAVVANPYVQDPHYIVKGSAR